MPPEQKRASPKHTPTNLARKPNHIPLEALKHQEPIKKKIALSNACTASSTIFLPNGNVKLSGPIPNQSKTKVVATTPQE